MKIVLTEAEVKANHSLLVALNRELQKDVSKKEMCVQFEDYVKEAGLDKCRDGTYIAVYPEELFVDLHTVCKSHLRIIAMAGKTLYGAIETFKEVYKGFANDLKQIKEKFAKSE